MLKKLLNLDAFALHSYASILSKFIPHALIFIPLVEGSLQMWWMSVIIVLGCLIYLIYCYHNLNPKKQFIPPSLSVHGLTSFILNQKIEDSKSTTAWTSSLGLGTAVGGAIGALIGGAFGWALGKDLAEIKQQTYN